MVQHRSFCSIPYTVMLGLVITLCLLLGLTLAGAVHAAAAGSVMKSLGSNRCARKPTAGPTYSNDDAEDLELDVPVNIALDGRQRKRFLLFLNYSTPLTITFSQNVARKIYFNQTTNLSRPLKLDQRDVLLPCALRGHYDVILQARHRSSIKVEAHAGHPQAGWALLNRTNRVNIRTQNRFGKRQMIVKWDKSKFDIHAVHYCLAIDTRRSHVDFCSTLDEYVVGLTRQRGGRGGGGGGCSATSVAEFFWFKTPERAGKIDPRFTNVICTGARTQQLLRGLTPNASYFLDVFGVHTKRQNLSFHIASARVHFNRTHPVALRENELAIEKLSGLNGVQVFSFKIPPPDTLELRQRQKPQQLRYLVLPCGGSEVDVKILKRRRAVGNVRGIYRPTYIRLPSVDVGERYIMRVTPSNEDEILRANKVGLAVTTGQVFEHLPELPENITVFEVRSRCKSTTVAWYSSQDVRIISYCVIVFSLPHRSPHFIDYTNYCMVFVKQFMRNPHFYSIDCMEKSASPAPFETHTILNLTPGEGYLVYVTANLSEGQVLPYQTLKVYMGHHCGNELYDSREQTAYY